MNFPEHTKLLLSFSADTECFEAVLDRTTLLSAIYWNSHEVISILLESGARTDVLDSRNATLLHYAARFGDLETLACLSQAELGYLDVDARDDSGYTAWEIFDSRHERCTAEHDDGVMKDSLEAFERFKEHVTRQSQSATSAGAGSEMVKDKILVTDGNTSSRTLPSTLAESPDALSKHGRSQTF